MSSSSSVTSDRVIGRVKWFNNKAGYGFITVSEGDRKNSDIFVHHKSIVVSSEQYIYLVQGEYVEFSLLPTEGGVHEFQAGNVKGINGGLLMCETRREFCMSSKSSQQQSQQDGEVFEPVSVPRSVNVRGSGPREELQTSAAPSLIKKRGRPPRTTQQKM